MEAGLHARRVSRRARALVLMTTIVAGMMALLTPSGAEARVYIWSKDGSGYWTEPSNWTYVNDGTGPGLGFPSNAGDVASFSADYTVDITATIPDGASVSVGQLYFVGNHRLQVFGTTGSLIFDNGSTPATFTTIGNIGPLKSHSLDVPMKLHSTLTMTVVPTAPVDALRFDEVGAARGLTKRGPGQLYLYGNSTYTGTTTVEDGRLILGASGLTAIRGNLKVGDGVGNAASAFVRIAVNRQLVNTADVTVLGDGKLDILGIETIDELSVTDGEVNVGGVGNLKMKQLTMAGGLLKAWDAGVLTLDESATATATSKGGAALRRDAAGTGVFNLSPVLHRFTINDGPSPAELEIDIPLVGTTAAVLKEGSGTLRFTGPSSNTYQGATIIRAGSVELARDNGAISIPGPLQISDATFESSARIVKADNIADATKVSVVAGGILYVNANDTIDSVTLGQAARIVISSAILAVQSATMTAGRVEVSQGYLAIEKDLNATSVAATPTTITGDGSVRFTREESAIVTPDGPADVDLRIVSNVFAKGGGLIKRGPGVALLLGIVDTTPIKMIVSGVVAAPALEPIPLLPTRVFEGTLLLSGKHDAQAELRGSAGAVATLGGEGTLGAIGATSGIVAPGTAGAGKLTVTGPVQLTAATTFAVELNGTGVGVQYDQLDVRGTVNLGGAKLTGSAGFTPPPQSTFIIISNDGTDAVTGTFAGLAEGATARLGSKQFTISYRGGDGNDVVLTEAIVVTYFLAEGATGGFFDDDVVIANPNAQAAPVTLTFLKEGGSTIVDRRTIPAQSRVTVQVEQIPGLEQASVSVQVTSDNRLPLIVERSMFWDASYYGGHTANAVEQPETRWIFAEGFQGFFDTYILIANANAQPTAATLTFLRENDTPVVKTVAIPAFARKTVYAGEFDELKGRAFGVVVDATLPVIAERSMYFATVPNKLWSGGHVNTGITAPSKSWFHAEGATGKYFSTFILLSNPQDTDAHVELSFLLDTGDVVTRTKTIGAKQRVTINPADEGDVRLENAAVSTVVQSDVPIVSERSMYWTGDAEPFGEGHNSSGVAATDVNWGLAEGRIGGPHEFDTYILLANPTKTEATVTITYLREGGAPIVKQHTVPATSRFNIDVKTLVPELINTSFGARIQVTNNVPIAVERSIYWNANGAFWAGGSNALGTPLAQQNSLSPQP